MSSELLAIFGLPGGAEWIVIGVIALLIFGRRLPDVARSVGKSIVEFKKGLQDVKDDIEDRAQMDSNKNQQLENKDEDEKSPESAERAESTKP